MSEQRLDNGDDEPSPPPGRVPRGESIVPRPDEGLTSEEAKRRKTIFGPIRKLQRGSMQEGLITLRFDLHRALILSVMGCP